MYVCCFDSEEAETASELNQAMEASGMAAIRARGGKKDELGVQTNQLVRSVKTFDDACVFDHPSLNLPFLTCRRRFFFFRYRVLYLQPPL